MSRSSSRTAADWPALRVIEGGLGAAIKYAEPPRPLYDAKPGDLVRDRDPLVGIASEDDTGFDDPADSPALSAALDAVTSFRDRDLVMVPREPDALMVATGAAVAGVDRITAERIYRAMVRLAE